jgi:hypothetical protein
MDATVALKVSGSLTRPRYIDGEVIFEKQRKNGFGCGKFQVCFSKWYWVKGNVILQGGLK